MGEYELATAAWNNAVEQILAREAAGLPVPESWYRRQWELYQQAAAAEVAHKAARQGALWGEGTARQYV